MAVAPVSKRAEAGKSRDEYYTKTKLEPFGLNKRARRIAKGDKTVTTPDGKKFCVDNSLTGV